MKLKLPIAITLSIAILSFPLASSIKAATTPTIAPTDAKLKQIDDLKDRLATKVAQLQQLQRRAIFGTVKTVSLASVTISTKTKDIKIELPDEIEIFQLISGKRTKLTTDDLATGDVVTVFGNYDTTLDLLKAKIIFIHGKILTRVSGTITNIDKTEYTVTIASPEGPSYVIDIENYTKTFVWTGETGITKTGFSKLTIGETIHVLGTINLKKENRLSANRILSLGNLSGEIAPTLTPTITIAPTTKMSPTIVSTPKASPTP